MLAEHARRRLNDAEVDRASDLCAGNPLLLEQVALAVARGEEIPRADGRDMRGAQDRLLLGRFAGLPAAGMACAGPARCSARISAPTSPCAWLA